MISAVEAVAVAVPLAVETKMATRTVTARCYTLTAIRCDDGHDGVGFTYAGTSGGQLVRDAIHDVLAPVLVGRTQSEIDALWGDMYQESLLLGRRGAMLRAMSAVDIALFDAASKDAGVSLATFLGASTDAVPGYASGGYYREGQGLGDLREELEGNIELGFADHKIKVGGLTVAEDARRVEMASHIVGPDGRLALDANNGYRHATEAIEAARTFESAATGAPLWWFEEPLSPEDMAGHAAVRRSIDTPVATGELHPTRWDFRQLIAEGAADIIQADAAVVGGVSEWVRVASMASEQGIPLAPHWNANIHVHLVAATPGCLAVEHFDLAKDIFNFERLLTEDSRLAPANGVLPVPSSPGIGLVFDSEAVARFKIT